MIYPHDLIARKESNERKAKREKALAKKRWNDSMDRIAKENAETNAKIEAFEKANCGLSDDELLEKMFFEG